MICPNCNNEIRDDASFCSNCGSSLTASCRKENSGKAAVAKASRIQIPDEEFVESYEQDFTNSYHGTGFGNSFSSPGYNVKGSIYDVSVSTQGKGLGIASFILGIFGLFGLAIFTALPGLICGILSCLKAKEAIRSVYPLAIAGIVLSAVVMLMFIFLLILGIVLL